MRLIDADRLTNSIEAIRDCWNISPYVSPEKARNTTDAFNTVIQEIREAPSIVNKISAADVAPVVRCRDCKYYRVSTMLAPNKFCFRLKHPVEDRPIGYNFAPDDFCSYGEREEND